MERDTTAKNTFTGAFWGAASGTMNFEIGNIGNVYSRIAAHTAAEGAMEGIRGGHVEHGLLMGFTSSAGGAMINRYATNLTYAERVAVNTTLGGIISELGGGKFASGAMTAAYSMMFNDLAHEQIKTLQEYKRHLKKMIEADGKLTLTETLNWWKVGDGESLNVDINSLNLDFIDLKGKSVGDIWSFSVRPGGLNQWLVYGSVTASYIGNNQIVLYPDFYDFDIKTNPKNNPQIRTRNRYTKMGAKIHGKGKPFYIFFNGKYTLK